MFQAHGYNLDLAQFTRALAVIYYNCYWCCFLRAPFFGCMEKELDRLKCKIIAEFN